MGAFDSPITIHPPILTIRPVERSYTNIMSYTEFEKTLICVMIIWINQWVGIRINNYQEKRDENAA